MDFFTGSDKNSPEVVLFTFPVFKFKFSRLHLSIFAKSFENLTNFLGFSTGSSSISAGSGPKSADFSKFSRLHALPWQKVAEFGHRKRKWGPKMLKNHVF